MPAAITPCTGPLSPLCQAAGGVGSGLLGSGVGGVLGALSSWVAERGGVAHRADRRGAVVLDDDRPRRRLVHRPLPDDGGAGRRGAAAAPAALGDPGRLPPERGGTRAGGRRPVAPGPGAGRGGGGAGAAGPRGHRRPQHHDLVRLGHRRPAGAVAGGVGAGVPGGRRPQRRRSWCCWGPCWSPSAPSCSGSSSSCGRPRSTWRCSSSPWAWPASCGRPSPTGAAAWSTRWWR